MTLSVLLLLGQTAPPSLSVDKDGFTVRGLGKEVHEPLARSVTPPERVTYRKDDAFAVWDSRGLSIRHGKFVYSTRLPELALTPKLHSTDEIISTRDAISAGERKKEASALSGSRRIGDDVYFLARWEDKSGKPWLEALVKVNLSAPKPKPELVGQFEGFTTAQGTIDDQLLLISGNPGAFVRQPEGPWGVASFIRLEKRFDLRKLGDNLLKLAPISPRLALAMERTQYGKVRLARIDLMTGSRRELAELNGNPVFIDAETPPLVRVPTNLGFALRNLETGVQMNLPDKATVRRTAAGILVWPEGKPELASLYSPERFLRLATAAKAAVTEGSSQQSAVKRNPPPKAD